jgi:tetratricopeptide (TPR) repeat protein
MPRNKTATLLLSKKCARNELFCRRIELLFGILLVALTGYSAAAESPRQQVTRIVTQIQRADYEGDRAALPRLYDQLTPFITDKDLGSRVRYWRGFALWRRALNGANESVDAKELDSDLEQAVSEFREAAVLNPAFVDAKIAAASCLFFRMFLNRGDSERVKEFLPEALQLMKDAQAAEPDNPRFLWVQGGTYWYLPPERGGGEGKAMDTYQKGLDSARKQKSAKQDSLNPKWGEPELLMNLSWSSLHLSKPDTDAAEQYANEALKLIPYWHYVRDNLLQQIQASKQKH